MAAAAGNITDATVAAKALTVAKIPSFWWIDVVAKVPTLGTYLASASANKELLEIIIYDLPDRDCAALASNGEFSIADGGLDKYKVCISLVIHAHWILNG